MPTISVIVPIYNAEKYLNQCIDSILNQTFTDFELILVDDGSTDKSGEICDSYSARRSNVVVLHNENRGAAASRNAGLNLAKGKYVLFCDADDWYDSKVLEDFLKKCFQIISDDALYCFDFRNAWPDYVDNKSRYSDEKVMFISSSNKINFLSGIQSHKTMGYSVCNKLYNLEIIQKYNIRFYERGRFSHKDDWAEDLMFNIKYCMFINKIEVYSYPVYMIRKHGTENQQSEKGLSGRFEHMMGFMEYFYDEFNKPGYSEIKDGFWEIAVWHLKRYFYIDFRYKGFEKTRREYLESSFWPMAASWINTALVNWKIYSSERWSEFEAKDYKYMLQYLLNGNSFKYKAKNYLLWNVIGKLHKGR